MDFSALHVALSGVRSARTGLDTMSHNVANASTPGYTRQRVLLRSSHSRDVGGHSIGTGVTVGDIGRVRDHLADIRVRSAAASVGFSSARAELLSHTEVLFGEPDQGISTAMADLWAAFDELALAPADPGARATTLGALEETASTFRMIDSSLTELGDIATSSLQQAVADVNGMLQEVADLNDAIVGSAVPDAGLLDQRDVLLDELSQTIGAKAIQQDDGSVRVTVNGMSLVSEVQVSPLSINSSGEIERGGIVLTPNGEVGGIQAFLSDDVVAAQTMLNTIAEDFATALNTVHAAGFTEAGPGGALFTFTPGDAASTLEVAISSIDEIAASGSTGSPFPVNDATNADALAAVRDALVADGGTASLATSVRELVTDLGQRTAAANSSADSASELFTAASDDRESQHGVSIDEEMISLMEYQRMFEAASRVITAVDQALDVLVNRTGIVGR